jgi:hypothetical protein
MEGVFPGVNLVEKGRRPLPGFPMSKRLAKGQALKNQGLTPEALFQA